LFFSGDFRQGCWKGHAGRDMLEACSGGAAEGAQGWMPCAAGGTTALLICGGGGFSFDRILVFLG